MMYQRIYVHMLLLAALMLAIPAAEAQKGQGKGNGKMSRINIQTNVAVRGGDEMTQPAMKAPDEPKEIRMQEQKKLRAIEKQQMKKTEQIHNESGKGSERGQEARSNRRKWWKFWGQEKDAAAPETQEAPVAE